MKNFLKKFKYRNSFVDTTKIGGSCMAITQKQKINLLWVCKLTLMEVARYLALSKLAKKH